MGIGILRLFYMLIPIKSRLVNYSATSNRASCFNHYCVGYDIHNATSYTMSTGV